ncbi:MAG: hypothetical protein FJ098_01180 [Deltaproteobacteria bacterium]|nr:hypothetical protein [Deltaproteobacteria bacterium]
MTSEITVLVDYKGQLYCPHKRSSVTTDLEATARHFAAAGWRQVVRRFEEVDFRTEDFRGRWVLYQSSQDRGLSYRSYIEDVVLGLHLQGARLLPPYHLLRAHHNKVFMEILRDLSPDPALRTLRARSFGTLEDFARAAGKLRYPVVLKRAAGDSGTGVRLARSAREAVDHARRLSRTPYPGDLWENVQKTLRIPGFTANSRHRGKFIVQEFVPGLDRDFKCLAFGDRFFWEQRGARPGDFRASGSKVKRIWPREEPPGLLDFFERAFHAFGAPWASIDVMYDGRTFHLGEIQFLRFGTKPLKEAPHYWQRGPGGWERVDEVRCWEEELVRAALQHMGTGGVPG